MNKDNIYKDCSEIPIFNFFELVKEKDLQLLLRPGHDLKDFDVNELSQVVIDMLREYNAITDNTKLMREYQDKLDIEYYEARYNMSKKIISLYLEHNEIEVLLLLKDLQWQLNELESIGPQLKRIQRNLIGLSNKIKIKKANFVKKYKRTVGDENDSSDLEKQILYLESSIPLHYKIDIYTDSIKRFVYWNEILENKNKQLNNG